jgi:hypothetical protein
VTNNRDWIDDQGALCVSVIRGTSQRDVLEHFGRGDVIEFASREQAARWAADARQPRLCFSTGEVGDATFVWEDNGWRGSDAVLAARLSRLGEFASMYWNVNALSVFTFASSGEIVTQFEALWAPDALTWSSLVEFGAVHVADEDWFSAPWASGLTLQSQVLELGDVAKPSWLALPGVRFWGGAF